GLVDVVKGYKEGDLSHTWINNGHGWNAPYLMNGINQSTGSDVTINYIPSTTFDNTGSDNLSDLPTNVWVTRQLTKDNRLTGDQNVVSTINYAYKNGMQYFDPPEEIEFRGFGEVTVENENSITNYFFHQDNVFKGIEYRTEIWDKTGNVYSVKDTNYTSEEQYADVNLILLNSITQTLFDGLTTNPESSNGWTSFTTYDEYDYFGNPLSITEHGDVSISGDERYNYFEYVNEENNWILGLTNHKWLKDSSNVTKNESWYYYDNSNDNSNIIKGLLTKIVSWNSEGDDPVFSYNYDSYGNVIEITDPNNASKTVGYDSNNIYPKYVENALNQCEYYEFNDFGRITKITDSNGISTEYTYDSLHRISKLIRPEDSISSPSAQYTYYQDGVAPESILTSLKEDELTGSTFDSTEYYDGFLQAVQKDYEGEYGTITQKTYYNELGLVESAEVPHYNNETGLSVHYIYDTLGREKVITNTDGTTISYTYDLENTTIKNQNGVKKTFTYDIFGNIVKVYEFNEKLIFEELADEPLTNGDFETGNFTDWIQYRANITNESYDGDYAASLSINGLEPDANAAYIMQKMDLTNVDTLSFYKYYCDLGGRYDKFYVYIGTDRKEIREVPVGIWQKDTIDASGYEGEYDVIFVATFGKTIYPNTKECLSVLIDNISAVRTDHGSGADRLLSVESETYVTTYKYDAVNNLAEIMPDNEYPHFEEILNEHATKNGFETGEFTDWIQYRANITSQSYGGNCAVKLDINGLEPDANIAYIIRPINLTHVDSLTFYNYCDLEGRLGRFYVSIGNNRITTRISPEFVWKKNMVDVSGYEGVYNVTFIATFDRTIYPNTREHLSVLIDNISAVTEYEVSMNHPEVIPSTYFTYDSLGRKIAMNDPDMGNWTYAYDLNGNLITQSDSRGISTYLTYDILNRVTSINYPNDDDVSYTYDLTYNGTLSEVTKGNVSSSYTYDTRYRVTNETVSLDGADYTTSYNYDSMDRVTKITYPDSTIVDLTYNAQSLLESIDGIIDNIDYNARNQITEKELSNGVVTTYTYDTEKLLLERLYTDGLQDLVYDFDNVGNILEINDNVMNSVKTYRYDDLDRLTSAGMAVNSINTYQREFNYDQYGCILEVDENGTTISLYGYSETPFHAPTTYNGDNITYDSNGNLIEDGEFTYIYNDANQISEVRYKDNNSLVEKYWYDSEGRRIKKENSAGELTYYINKYFEIENGTITTYFFRDDERVAKQSVNGTDWYLPDHLGSTNLLVNENGSEVERSEYLPYGQVQSGGSEKYGFTGKENDADTGLMYYGARYYSPEYRIFIQPDTMLPDPYNPQALNRYAYTLNNPVKYNDPDGHVVQIVAAALAAGTIATGISIITQAYNAGWDFSQVSYSEAVAIGAVTSVSVAVGCIAASAAVGAFAVEGTLEAFAIFEGVSAVTTNVCQETMEYSYGVGDSEFDFGEMGLESGKDAFVSCLFKGVKIDTSTTKYVKNTDNVKTDNYNQALDTGKEVTVKTGTKVLIDAIADSSDDDSDKKKDNNI
ncbi:RHS repeat domain-containing protein, partial [Methanococcus maripaludis]